MDSLMKRWYDAAQHRASVRKFDSALNRDCFYALRSFIASNLISDQTRLVLLAKNGILESLIIPYGKITGTNCFAAVIADKGNKYMAGYLGEAFVLECMARGYATCWLGASYKKSLVKQLVKLSPNEIIVGIIAVGLCDKAVKPAKKKSVERLTGLTADMFDELPAWQQEAVRCARLAPSALNIQPWTLLIQDDSIGIFNTAYKFGFSEIDKGIAMLHIELGAASEGAAGEWNFDGDTSDFTLIQSNLSNESGEYSEQQSYNEITLTDGSPNEEALHDDSAASGADAGSD